MHQLWFRYIWPSLYGNGPEDVISLIVVGLVGAVVYPPVRRWIKREWENAHAKLDANKKLLAHIIEHHPDIPSEHGVELPPDGRPRSSRRAAS